MGGAADTVRRLLACRDNDYSELAAPLREWFGVQEWAPLEFERPPPGLPPLSITVVIPAWNAAATIAGCLQHLAASTLKRRAPEALEVIVVDDGSDDGTWERLCGLECDLDYLAVRQEHRGRAQAMNVGTALASGDVVVSCDADMLLLPGALEELRLRHQMMPSALVVGYRSDVDAYPLVRERTAGSPLPGFAFGGDTRLAFTWPGWPENISVTTEHLKRYGHRRRLWMPSGEAWELSRNVFGCLFSVRRGLLVEMDGYDEGFAGWGWEDALVGARAIALGQYVVPAYGAAGFHVRHPLRSRRQWREGARNHVHFERLLGLPPSGLATGHLRGARQRVLEARHHRAAGSSGGGEPSREPEPADELGRGEFHLSVGCYELAAGCFARVADRGHGLRRARLGLARALRLGGRQDAACAVLRELASSPEVFVELARAEAGQGRFESARRAGLEAERLSPRDRLVRFLLHSPRGRFLRRARRHWRQGFGSLAVQDLEAILIQDPGDVRTALLRDKWLAAAGPGSD